MIISVEEVRKHITTDEQDSTLEVKLQALELLIRKETNNNFQQRNIRFQCPVLDGRLCLSTEFLKKGDTVQISQSLYNDGLYTVTEAANEYIVLKDSLIDEPEVLITKVVYPMDIKMGVLNMLKWDLENRDKVGVQSETISRHSVTYFNMDGDNSAIGYPKSLTGFLKPYRKARF